MAKRRPGRIALPGHGIAVSRGQLEREAPGELQAAWTVNELTSNTKCLTIHIRVNSRKGMTIEGIEGFGLQRKAKAFMYWKGLQQAEVFIEIWAQPGV